ncbi:MAG: polyphosphate kinase 2 family protein [Planctomycetes bacterium]|nr:polyphosphate kinase 2 family protein [Planctomycetota bacterium]
MFQDYPESPYRVGYDGAFKVKRAPTAPPKDAPGKKRAEQELDALVKQMRKLQDRLYASDDHAILLVFQAMDAAGKDGTIRAVMTGVNPAGCQVYSFKQPSAEELDHDFLWRCALRLPERGRIGIFNRSYYEEVLVVRVHPEFLRAQKLPWRPERLEDLWEQRYESIRNFELHLARQGTVIIKFWLHVGRDEQKRRFLARIDEGAKNWKFSSGDIKERGRWKDYMKAYEDALAATSRPWAPWYAIPADDKAFMRLQVAHVITETLRSLGLEYPALSPKDREQLAEMRRLLEAEDA